MAIKIMIDSGHYTNYNQSKVYKKYYEGNMTWKLQSYLKKELEEYGFKVSVTRTSRDKDMAVYDRGYMAKGYDVFLSLHSNACDSESVDRVVVIKGYDQKDTLAAKFGEALTKAMKVKQKYQIMTKKTTSGGEYYGVLRGAKAAGVANRFILEHGFHTNTNTAKWLCDDANIKKLAEVNAKVLADHYGYKKKSSTNDKQTVNQSSTNGWTNGDHNCKVRATANLNLREGRGTGYNIIKTIPKGTIFTVGYVMDNWGSTWDFGKVGYFCCDYIEKI